MYLKKIKKKTVPLSRIETSALESGNFREGHFSSFKDFGDNNSKLSPTETASYICHQHRCNAGSISVETWKTFSRQEAAWRTLIIIYERCLVQTRIDTGPIKAKYWTCVALKIFTAEKGIIQHNLIKMAVFTGNYFRFLGK